uniref:Uncharacterized protein n=1 Tax=Arundo donax TaxID=35708 RepID=A0A0A9B135_ARUDO
MKLSDVCFNSCKLIFNFKFALLVANIDF